MTDEKVDKIDMARRYLLREISSMEVKIKIWESGGHDLTQTKKDLDAAQVLMDMVDYIEKLKRQRLLDGVHDRD